MSHLPKKYRNLFRYVYALIAVVIVTAIALMFTLYRTQQADNVAMERVASYHLSSAGIAEKLHHDTQDLHQLLRSEFSPLHTAADGQVLAGLQDNPGNSLYAIRSGLMQLSELQSQFSGNTFVATLERLLKRFETIEELAITQGPADATRESIEAFELNIAQLSRLHQITATEILEQAQSQESAVLANLWILAVIFFVAAIIGGYIARLLHQSLVNQARTEEALAASKTQMYHMEKLDALGQLVGGVAHDFNNLLTVILGQSQLLDERASGDKFLREGLGEISHAAHQAEALTKQLLTFSRRQPLQVQTIDLNDSIRDIERMIRRLIAEDIELVFDYGDIRDPVVLDPGQLYQVILNLFINSRDAMPGGGRINLATGTIQIDESNGRSGQLASGHFARLVVSDTGVGMDELTQKRVFEPFFTTKPKGRGTGLGLSTVHGIVTAAKGHIFIDSRLNQGTRVEIYLPFTRRRAEEPADDSAASTGGSETVLVVEDEEQIRTFLRDGLGSLGYRVLTAAGGQEGLEICRRKADGIDVIVSDVVMPDMNGTEFMKHALPMQPSAVGIFMSGYTDDVVLQRGVDGLALPLINKPFKINTIAKIIRDRLK